MKTNCFEQPEGVRNAGQVAAVVLVWHIGLQHPVLLSVILYFEALASLANIIRSFL